MGSHAIPSTDRASAPPPSSPARQAGAASRAEAARGGPFPLPLPPSLRRQGPRLDPGPVPSGSPEGRLRGRLRLSFARRPRPRLRRLQAPGRDRRAASDDAPLLAGARLLRDRAPRHERDPAHGRGGPRLAQRAAESAPGLARRSGFRGPGAQVPDLGAVVLPGPSRGGAGARPASQGRAGRGRGAMSEAPRHIPVLLAEVLEALQPRDGSLVIDATFGAGGYSQALIDRGARVVALDRDPSAIRAGAGLVASSGGRLRLVEARFGALDAVANDLGLDAVDGVAFDIGVSAMQLDEAERGFSLRFDAPLDMRMGNEGRTAADILKDENEATIADILYHFGEERAARRIARAIVADREAAPFVSTLQLAQMIARVAPARRGELTHPATRAFQALRIAVNDELGELLRGLVAAERLLAPGGRLAVVAFHSLEDRIVKQFLAGRSGRGRAASRLLPGEPAVAEPTFEVPRGQPIEPGEAEASMNPRSRSAKLRYALRLAAPAQAADGAIEALTRLPLRRRRHG